MPDRKEPVSMVFSLEKATKNTFKYEECPEPGQPPKIGALYIQKWAFGHATPPQEIRLTVEFEADGQKQ